VPVLFYNNEDRLFVGLNYRIKKNKWRKDPFASNQTIGVRYSISQQALSAFWKALYPNVIGRWNLALRAEYDVIRWINFYGTGNETKSVTNDINYYRLRSEEWYASAGLNRVFGKSTVQATGYYQRTKSKNDTDRYPSKVFSNNDEVFMPNQYACLQLTYSYVSLNDSVVPVKGFTFITNATFANNFSQKEFFQRYNSQLQTYLTIIRNVSLAVRLGGETIVNDAVLNTGQAYEHAIIGGPRTLRGYRRERFWGKTAFYNSNELRYITNFHTYLMTGKIGLFAFFDQGRVWMPGERSDKMHTSWGPGMLLVPFNKASISVTYGISEEVRLVQIRLNRLL
jgi:hemolysin activation/secretion protein